jgi:hypothetical protein
MGAQGPHYDYSSPALSLSDGSLVGQPRPRFQTPLACPLQDYLEAIKPKKTLEGKTEDLRAETLMIPSTFLGKIVEIGAFALYGLLANFGMLGI